MSNYRATTVILLAGLLIVSIFPGQAALADDKEPVYDATTDVVARRTATAPVIDGIVDAVWDDARSFYAFATGPNGNFDIYVRVMFDDDYIYLLTSWDEIDDPGADPPMIPGDTVQREAWELTSNSTPGTWDHKDWGEDRISFLFQDPDAPVEAFTNQGCDGVCHNTDTDMFTPNAGEILDVWVWSAATTNPQGYADDGSLKNNNSVTHDPQTMHVTEADIHWDSGNGGWIVNNDTSVGGSRPTHVWKPGATPADPRLMYASDAVEVDWGTFDITTVPQGIMVPGHVLETPTGDRHWMERGVQAVARHGLRRRRGLRRHQRRLLLQPSGDRQPHRRGSFQGHHRLQDLAGRARGARPCHQERQLPHCRQDRQLHHPSRHLGGQHRLGGLGHLQGLSILAGIQHRRAR